MAYSASDLTAIEAAIVALAKGERVVTVEGPGGRSITYQQADLDKLRALRDNVSAEISVAAGRRRFVLTSSGKGL